MKVAIIGLSPSTHGAAPWDDRDWELWGLAWDTFGWPFFARTFEMHQDHATDASYLERLEQCAGLYMQSEGIAGAQRYPFEAVAATVQDSAWASSIAYAMALAIHEGAQEIALYGVDMATGSEYAYQRPNMNYLIGLARGRGIKVHVPEQSALLRFESNEEPQYVGRYGWLG